MDSSGAISLQGDLICYESESASWKLSIHLLQVVGEATTDQGPFVDDYWLCFATGPNEWYEASYYASGRDEFLKGLSARLETSLDLQLVSLTNYASRVLWPVSLANQPMFVYMNVRHENRSLRSVAQLLRKSYQNVQSFSPEVYRYLQETTEPPCR